MLKKILNYQKYELDNRWQQARCVIWGNFKDSVLEEAKRWKKAKESMRRKVGDCEICGQPNGANKYIARTERAKLEGSLDSRHLEMF